MSAVKEVKKLLRLMVPMYTWNLVYGILDRLSLYILRFTRSYSVFRSFSKEQDYLMREFLGILC